MGRRLDGRKAGEETSKNASPQPGADREGVTALIHSATTINNQLANVGFCLDVMLHPTTIQGEGGLDVLYHVMRTYMDKGGQSIHFNVFDSTLLRDAQAHPEKYENLQVRVCGWNVLWNNMPKSEQDAYILRAENIAQ
jgi:pyruvate-formate lyase